MSLTLQLTFDCEGGLWKEKDGRIRIRFSIHKVKKILKNGIVFVEQIKNMLSEFGISTTEIWLIDMPIRKDGNEPIAIRFDVKKESINTFLREIGFNHIKKKAKINQWGRKRHGTLNGMMS